MATPRDQVDEAARGQAETPEAHGDDCPCTGCHPNEALSIADRRLLWELIGERKAPQRSA